nr:BRCT domain-containing protein [Alkalibaculum bacchi]
MLKIKTYSLKARDITPNLDINYDGDCILQDKTCVFTGTLTRMIRKEAMQIVVNLGGLVGDGVTKKTNYLIIPLWAYKTILNL